MVATGAASGSGAPVWARICSTRSALTLQSSAILATVMPPAACRATSAYSLAGMSASPKSSTHPPGLNALGVATSPRCRIDLTALRRKLTAHLRGGTDFLVGHLRCAETAA
jgi:hypothetical protein